MAAVLAESQVQGVWLDRWRVEEAEYKYQEYLVRSQAGGESNKVKGGEKSVVIGDKNVQATTTAGRVAQQIAEARKQIQETLKDSYAATGASAGGSIDSLRSEIERLRKEQSETMKLVTQMTSRFDKLEVRLTALEGGTSASTPAKTEEKPAEEAAEDSDEDDSDVDLFGSDDEEEDAEAERIKQERLAAYREKKSKKPAAIAKSNIVLDVKPWDDETDMEELTRLVRTVACDGLVWGSSKLVEVAYGIKKLMITCVVEDDKVGTDFLEEEITKFEDYVQSVDIAAFNKV